jgi:H+/Cl- antiporter ClcA
MIEKLKAGLWIVSKEIAYYAASIVKWIVCSVLIGLVCGSVGVLFHFATDYAGLWQRTYQWLLYCLPVAGLLIIWCYHVNGVEKDEGTNLVIASIRKEGDLPANMPFLIFIGTVLTHLCGGSSGREGAALQIGGSIGSQVGRLLHMNQKDLKIITMCGMCALFTALFGTPITAAIFSMEVISVGVFYYVAFLPCIISALIAYALAGYFGVEAMHVSITQIPDLSFVSVIQVGVLALLCAFISVVFILTMHHTGRLLHKWIQSDYVRVFVGGCVIVLLTLIEGSGNYNGPGVSVIEQAMVGNGVWYAFLLKIVFTAITLGSGFKGGEIIPSFFIGSTFGLTVGMLLGLPGSFAAGIGMIALFCGVVNCPIASLVLSIELFGSEGLLYFAIACAVSYIASGYYSLYSTQKIVYSKLHSTYINVDAK